MVIELQHFDTKLKQELDVSEPIANSLAEYLFPDTDFSVGMVYTKAAVPEDLGEYKGKTLQFAAGERMYFANHPVRDLIYPNPSDGAAYGSIVFTPCQSFWEKKVRVLVVDDSTGANGEILPPHAAKKLVGDCYGKLSQELARELTGRSDTPFQFRIAIKPQPGCDVCRIAKGTLAPSNLNNLGQPLIRKTENGKIKTKFGYDMVLATSSFKGRKGNDAIQPGEYDLVVGIGVKTLAKYREHSLGTQVLVNYPRAVEADILPKLEEKAEKLAQIQSDPRLLAIHYIEQYERRNKLESDRVVESERDFETDLKLLNSLIDEVLAGDLEQEESPEREKQDFLLYRILKVDLEKHSQLLEHPKIIDGLNQYVRKQWIEIATGRAIKFQSGLAQPSWDLAKDEICIPTIAEDVEVIVTRSPLVNSNGTIVLKNKHLPEAMRQRGTVHIHPETAAKHLQADFDGDCLAFERASKYPTLTAEIKECNLSCNRYPDIVKRDKIAYKGSFEEIAISAMENKIGIIANLIQKSVALQWETQLIPSDKKNKYLNRISSYYKDLSINNNLPQKKIQIPPQFEERIRKLANLPQELSSEQIDRSLADVKQILFDTVSELSNELQVAVDGPKSAARPNETILAQCEAISGYTSVGWLADKKNPQAYLDRPMTSTNYSPIDLMVKQTNQFYAQSRLVARHPVQFRPLFQGVNFSKQHEAEARKITRTYNLLIDKASSLEKMSQKKSGLSLIATSSLSGKKIEIQSVLKFDPTLSLVRDRSNLDIKLFPNERKSRSNTLMAVIITDAKGESCYQPIGIVSEESVKEHNLRPGTRLSQAAIVLTGQATAEQVKAKFEEATRYLNAVRQNTPAAEHLSMAAALWEINHARTKVPSNNFKKASIAFNTYPNLVIDRLNDLQFTNLRVVGVHQPTNEHLGKKWHGEKVQCEITLESESTNPNYGKRIVLVEGKKLGPLFEQLPSLPPNTRFQAEITSVRSPAAIATTARGNSLRIDRVKNYDFADREWNTPSARIGIGFVSHPNSAEPAIPVALLEDKVLGVFDKQSIEKLKAANLLKPGVNITVNLQSIPSMAAALKVDPQSVVYSHHSVPFSFYQTASVNIKSWNVATKELSLEDWAIAATAVGQSPKYVERVKQVIEAHKTGQELSEQAKTAMQRDLQAYEQTSHQLKCWYEAAKELDKPEAYLKQIDEVAAAFHHPSIALPLTEQAVATMQRDIQNHQRLNVVETQLSFQPLISDPERAWQHFSQQIAASTPIIQGREVAIAALKAGVEPNSVRQIITASPGLQNLGERSLGSNVDLIMRYAENQVQQKLIRQQQQSKQQTQHIEL